MCGDVLHVLCLMCCNAQRLSKLHDEYQFPTRLDLAEFVSSSEEGSEGGPSPRTATAYILHSVLAHSVSKREECACICHACYMDRPAGA